MGRKGLPQSGRIDFLISAEQIIEYLIVCYSVDRKIIHIHIHKFSLPGEKWK